jgi:hypothetical protein
MDEAESSTQFEVACLSKRKRIVNQPDTISQREYGIRLRRLTRYS